MLYEIKNVKQESNDQYRRWFEDDYFDLIVWYNSSKEITGFQLCYDRFNDEHAITWIKNTGFYHNKIDDGPIEYHTMYTPVLVADGIFPKLKILSMFEERSNNIDENIAHLIIEKLNNYDK